jgi:multidrug resistance efflux pump
LDEFIKQLKGRLDEVEGHFDKGRVVAPIAGIISTGLAYVGQSVVAGTPIAEILDPTDIFVDWYIPNERLVDPKAGNDVLVLFGNRRIRGKIAEILPVSGVYAGTQQQLLTRDRPATQIARIRFEPGAVPPPLTRECNLGCKCRPLSGSRCRRHLLLAADRAQFRPRP